MSRIHRAPWIAGLALLALFPLASCGKKADTTTAGTNTPMPGEAVKVTDVDLGRAVDANKQVTDKADVFKPGDTIYASVHTSGSAPSTRIAVKWTFQDGQVVDQSEQTIAPDGSAATEFHISKPDGFPAGNYKVEVFVDGSSAQSKDFKVQTS